LDFKRQKTKRDIIVNAYFKCKQKQLISKIVIATIYLLIYLIFVLFLFSDLTFAEPSYGRDYLALQSSNFSAIGAAKYVSPGFSFGVLDCTFSCDTTKTESVLSQVSTKYLRIHEINGPCIRNGNCGKYEIGYGYNKTSWDIAVSKKTPKIIAYVKKRTQVWLGISQHYPQTTFIISPELEHDLSKKSWRVLADTVKSVWPNVLLSNSPDGGLAVERYLGAWLEGHGATPNLNSDIVSTDGQSISYMNIEAFKRRTINAQLVFSWEVNDNCRLTGGNFIDPRKRPWCPNNDQFQVLAHILDFVPSAPKFVGTQCKIIKSFKDPLIWKPLPEQFPKPDPRVGLPCGITTFNNKKALQVLSSNGSIIGSLGYYGTYGKMFRYYSGWKNGSHNNGYQMEKAASLNTESPWVWLRNGNACQGPLIPGRRQGTYK